MNELVTPHTDNDLTERQNWMRQNQSTTTSHCSFGLSNSIGGLRFIDNDFQFQIFVY